MSGIYIHIPFCKSRCIYCDFYSSTLQSLRDDYVAAINEELHLRKDYLSTRARTIYIGGGTPSLLNDSHLHSIFRSLDSCFTLNEMEEITIEVNPDDVTDAKALLWRVLGINRVSMGVQSFDNQRLTFLRRRHTAKQAKSAFTILRKAGFENISIDLMFGFPNQSVADWQSDLNEALSLRPEHISAYSLMIEENTPLWRMYQSGKVETIGEETSRSMYQLLCNTLAESEYEHYEISNFSLPGYYSRHNSNYWKSVEYMGLGAAAHSYNVVSRQWNVNDITTYIEQINKGEVPAEIELLTDDMRYNDLITTALRTRQGISLYDVERDYGKQRLDYMLREARSSLDNGLLALENDHLRLTKNGLFVSDDVMSRLIYIEN